MVDRLAVVAEARSAIGHQALALGGAHGAAQVGLARLTELALAAFGGIERNHVIADSHRGDALAHRLNDAATLMTEDAGEYAFRILSGEGVGVGMANTGGDDTDQDLASLGRGDIHFDDLQGLVGAEGNGGARFDGHEHHSRLMQENRECNSRLRGD